MDTAIPRGNVALAAADQATAAERQRLGLSYDDEAERDRMRGIADRIYAQYAAAEVVVEGLHKAANHSDESAIIDLLAREHAYLLDKIAWAAIKAVATRIDRMGGYVDGRISPVLGDFAKIDREWLEPSVDAIAESAPFLAARDEKGFSNKLALILTPPKPKTKPPTKDDGEGTE